MKKRDNCIQLRTIAGIVGIVGFWYSSMVLALGLGEIRLKSEFNQPLDAEIRLLKVGDLSEDEILASLASREDFQRAGVDRIFFLTGMKFEVVLDDPSNPFIHATTRLPVTEPYLNFLLDVQWVSGRILREYTLLLDLPVFGNVPSTVAPPATVPAQTTSPIATAPVEPSAARVRPAPETPAVKSSPTPPSASVPAPIQIDDSPRLQVQADSAYRTPESDDYEVQSGDTLWEIAQRVRTDDSVTINQIMIAIQQANPDAFIDDNINRLRSGRVLRMPSQAEITDTSSRRATTMVRQQNQTWRDAREKKAVLTAVVPAVTETSIPVQPEGRLTLGSADSGQNSVQGSGLSGGGEALQNDLAVAREELDRSRRENSELRSRVADLEAQIETMQQLVNVTNDQLKRLELVIKARPSSAAEEPDRSASEAAVSDDTARVDTASDIAISRTVAPETATPDEIEEVTDVDAAADSDEVGTGPVDAQNVTEVAEESRAESLGSDASAASRAVEQPVMGNPFIELIKRNFYVLIGGLLALLVAILLLLRLREKADEADFATGREEFDPPVEGSDNAYEMDEVQKEVQIEDVLAKADTLASLDQQDKALELLEKEIQQNPDNAAARLGILRIHAKAQNAAAFDEQYAQLLPLGDTEANHEATILRSNIVDTESFDTGQYSLEPTPDTEAYKVSESPFGADPLGTVTDGQPGNYFDVSGDDSADLSDKTGDSSEGYPDDLERALEFDDDFSLDDPDLKPDDSDDSHGAGRQEVGTVTNKTVTDDRIPKSDLDEALSFFDEPANSELDSGDESAFDPGKTGLDTNSGDVLSQTPEYDLSKALDDDNGDWNLDLKSVDGSKADNQIAEPVDEKNRESHESPLEPELDFHEPKPVMSMDGGSPAVPVADSLDLNVPPRDDLDIDHLDKEIDAITADYDDLQSDSLQSLATDNEYEQADGENKEQQDSFPEQQPDEAHSSSRPESKDTEAAFDFAVDDEVTGEQQESLAPEEPTNDLSLDYPHSETTTVPPADRFAVTDEASVVSEEQEDFADAGVDDEVATKLDLAKAYLDMGDREGAEDILGEVMEEGNSLQKEQARTLLRDL